MAKNENVPSMEEIQRTCAVFNCSGQVLLKRWGLTELTGQYSTDLKGRLLITPWCMGCGQRCLI